MGRSSLISPSEPSLDLHMPVDSRAASSDSLTLCSNLVLEKLSGVTGDLSVFEDGGQLQPQNISSVKQQ